jgi:hypothetical protein
MGTPESRGHNRRACDAENGLHGRRVVAKVQVDVVPDRGRRRSPVRSVQSGQAARARGNVHAEGAGAFGSDGGEPLGGVGSAEAGGQQAVGEPCAVRRGRRVAVPVDGVQVLLDHAADGPSVGVHCRERGHRDEAGAELLSENGPLGKQLRGGMGQVSGLHVSKQREGRFGCTA